MTDTTIDAVMPSIEVDGEPTTENIHLGYKWLINFLVTKGKDVSPIGYAGELVTPAEYAVLQQAHPGIPAGPYQPEPQPPADPVIPDGATQAQIQQANRRNTEAKERYKQRCNVIEKAKAHWISSCSPEHFDELRDPILDLGGCTLRELVDHIFNEWSVFDKTTRDQLQSEMTQEWTGGALAPVIARINRVAQIYARHGSQLREAEKVDTLLTLVENSGLLPEDCSQWRRLPEAQKTWPNACATFKTAAKDLKHKLKSKTGGYASGYANAAQQMAADTIEQQTTALQSANLMVQHSNTLVANYAKRVEELESQVAGRGSGSSGSGNKENINYARCDNTGKGVAQMYSESYDGAEFDERKALVVFQRYCHLYCNGELEELASEIDNTERVESSFESGNPFIILLMYEANTILSYKLVL